MVSQCLNFLNEQFFSSPVHTETRISSWTLLFVVLLFKPQFMNYLVVKTQISIHGTTGPPNNELSRMFLLLLHMFQTNKFRPTVTFPLIFRIRRLYFINCCKTAAEI